MGCKYQPAVAGTPNQQRVPRATSPASVGANPSTLRPLHEDGTRACAFSPHCHAQVGYNSAKITAMYKERCPVAITWDSPYLEFSPGSSGLMLDTGSAVVGRRPGSTGGPSDRATQVRTLTSLPAGGRTHCQQLIDGHPPGLISYLSCSVAIAVSACAWDDSNLCH